MLDYIGDLDYYYAPIQIDGIVNKIFGPTFIYYETEEGSDTNDSYSRYEEIYDPIKKEISVGETDYCYDGNLVFGDSVYDFIKEECENAAKEKNIPIAWGDYYPEGDDFYRLCERILEEKGGLKELGTRVDTQTLDDVDKIEIEKDIVDKIISTAKEIGYEDIEILVDDVIIKGNASPYNDGKAVKSKAKDDDFVIQSGLLLRYNGKDKVVTIPEGVTRIHNAFDHNEKIHEVIIPEGVTRIGESAFSDCHKLEKVTIPCSVTEIAKDAFFNTNIKSIILPEGIKEIAKGTFDYCRKLKEITIPKSVTKIGDYAFEGCSSLKKVVILNKDVEISELAFDDGVFEAGIIEMK